MAVGNKITPLDALRAVYERGERCRECEHCIWMRTRDRMSGRADAFFTERGCDILESQNYNFARDPEDCPGVEDELARSEDD